MAARALGSSTRARAARAGPKPRGAPISSDDHFRTQTHDARSSTQQKARTPQDNKTGTGARARAQPKYTQPVPPPSSINLFLSLARARHVLGQARARALWRGAREGHPNPSALGHPSVCCRTERQTRMVRLLRGGEEDTSETRARPRPRFFRPPPWQAPASRPSPSSPPPRHPHKKHTQSPDEWYKSVRGASRWRSAAPTLCATPPPPSSQPRLPPPAPPSQHQTPTTPTPTPTHTKTPKTTKQSSPSSRASTSRWLF